MSRRDHYAVIAEVLGGDRPGSRRFQCYAALGDSFTAGTGSPPGQSWADRLAAGLRSRNPRLLYRNLAIDGATSVEVLGQVGSALQLEPDLVTVICGGNDVLRSRRPDVDGYAERLEEIFTGLRALSEITLVTATAPTRWSFLGLGPRTAARVEAAIVELNAATRAAARAYGALCLEVAGHPGLEDPENFSDDGLHPSALGHARTARALASLLDARRGDSPDGERASDTDDHDGDTEVER